VQLEEGEHAPLAVETATAPMRIAEKRLRHGVPKHRGA